MPPTFSPGEVVADRYRIIDFIGRGGMGEIYEAEDLDLEVRVALKTVRREIADNEKALERFRREIQLARKVTHPNVCRIFDVGYYARPSDGDHEAGVETEEIVFLTMELLEGETLSTRLKREGRFAPEEALPIVEQIAEALDAAHRAGIVHRDFKSSNIILVRDDDSGAGMRAVVTDFGLARGVDPEDSLTSSFSVSSQPVGTPTYMAPEQVAGREITPAVDLYALGIVMYEMLTGAPPFVGDSPLSTAVKRLIDRPTPPREIISDLDPGWDEAILRCLEKDPAQRYGSARDVVKAIRGERVARDPIVRHPRRWIVPLAVLLVAIVAAIVFIPGLRDVNEEASDDGAGPPREAVTPRRIVAVVGFRNLTGRDDAKWLDTAFSEMLSTELGAGGQVRVLPGENVARMKQEMALGDVDDVGADTLTRVGRNLGANLLVSGAYVALGGEDGAVRLDVRVHDATHGALLLSFSQTGTEGNLFDLVGSVGARLRRELGLADLTASDESSLRTVQPANLEAARLYSEGIELIHRSDALGARQRLEKAVDADPGNPLAWSALAEAWSALGFDEKATESAKRAMDLSSGLSREERLLVEGRYRETTRQWDRAVEIYRALWNFFPDNLEYGLQLAGAQASAGRGKAALETVASLRILPAADGDPRVDLAEARAAESLSDFRRESEAAERAVEKGKAREARLLVGEAYLAEWWAWRNLGDLDRAIAASDAAKRVFSSVGDRGSVARALNAVATVARQQGRFDEAKSLDEESLSVFREIGDKRHESWALNNLGRAHLERGELRRALGRFEESLAVSREIGDRSGITRALGNVGNVEFELGNIDRARELYGTARDIATETGEARGLAWAKYNQSSVLLAEGEVQEAGRLAREALEDFRRIGELRGVSWDGVRIAEIDLAAGSVSDALEAAKKALEGFRDLEDSRGVHTAMTTLGVALGEHGEIESAVTTLSDARALQAKQGDTWSVASTDLALARVEIERGEVGTARVRIAGASKTYRREKSPMKEAAAELLLARADLGAGDLRSARSHAQAAKRLANGAGNRMLEIEIEIVSDRIDAGGDVSAAIKSASRLESAVGDARNGGYVALELEARLTLGAIEHQIGRTSTGDARLNTVYSEAVSKGLLRLSKDARAALGPAK